MSGFPLYTYQLSPLSRDISTLPSKRRKRIVKGGNVAVACQECRRRKTKCDGTKPTCNQCKSKGLPDAPCLYSDRATVPSLKRKAADLQKKLDSMQNTKLDGPNEEHVGKSEFVSFTQSSPPVDRRPTVEQLQEELNHLKSILPVFIQTSIQPVLALRLVEEIQLNGVSRAALEHAAVLATAQVPMLLNPVELLPKMANHFLPPQQINQAPPANMLPLMNGHHCSLDIYPFHPPFLDGHHNNYLRNPLEFCGLMSLVESEPKLLTGGLEGQLGSADGGMYGLDNVFLAPSLMGQSDPTVG